MVSSCLKSYILSSSNVIANLVKRGCRAENSIIWKKKAKSGAGLGERRRGRRGRGDPARGDVLPHGEAEVAEPAGAGDGGRREGPLPLLAPAEEGAAEPVPAKNDGACRLI